MNYDAQKVTYQEVAIFDRPALFTECRIDRTTVPEGVYRYELRHGDEDWGEPRELARGLMVNFYGTVLTREPFQLPIDGWIPLESGSLSFQDGGCRTLAEFQEKYPASEKDVIDFYSVNDPALHNLYFLQEFMRRMRQAILDDRFTEFRSDFFNHYQMHGKQ